jgi:hypothetical protein
MFNKKNDPLIDSVKAVMEQNELFRRIEQDLLEEYGVESRNALPHELQGEFDAVLSEAKKCAMEANLDPVGKEDKDIDNDGDVDKSDSYLHNRRKTIASKMSAKKIDEASYDKNLDEKKPVVVRGVKGMKSTPFSKKFKNMDHFSKWSDSEDAGNHTVHSVANLKEEQIDEKKLTSAEAKKKEELVMKMKGKGFEKRYPGRGKEVMYATATNMAKKLAEEEQIDEERKRIMKVADAFMKGQKAKEKTLATDGKQITYHGNVIAKHADDEVHVSTAGYGTSPSTRGHVNGILRRLNAPTLSQKKGEVYHGNEPYDGKSWIKVKKPSAPQIDEESIFEEIRQSLEERLTYAYENYDDAGFSDFVSSLTEEEIEILGLDEGISGTEGPAIPGPSNFFKRLFNDPFKRQERGYNKPAPTPAAPAPATPAPAAPAPAAKPATAPAPARTVGRGGGGRAQASTLAQAPAPAAKPATAPAPAARPVQRQAPRPAARPAAPKRMIPRSRPPSRSSYGAGSAGDVGSSLSGTVASRMSEETKPQIKESFESFLRNKFLKD